MKKQKNIIIASIIGLIFIFSMFTFGSLNLTTKSKTISNSDYDNDSLTPLNAGDEIEVISLNTTDHQILRATEWVNILINNGSTSSAPGGYIANITLVKGLDGITDIPSPQPTWNLTLLPVNSNEFSNIFQFPYTTPTGYAAIRVYRLNEDMAPYTYPSNITWIKVVNNVPKIGIELNSTTYKAGESIGMKFTPMDVENPAATLNWTVQILKEDLTPLTTLFTNQKNYESIFTIPLNSSDPVEALKYHPGNYIVKVSCTDLDQDVGISTCSFTIVNNAPKIESISYFINGVLKDVSELEVFRGLDVITIQVKATDLESNSSLRMSVTISDPMNNTNVPLNALNLEMTDKDNNLFIKNITLPPTAIIPSRISVGKTNLTVTITGEYPLGNYYYTVFDKPIQIKNNAPKMPSFAINNKTDARFSFSKDDVIDFTFNATDIENDIKYIRLEIIYKENEQEKSLLYSTPYIDSSTTIHIRAVDLPYSDYNIYAYVIDGDGAQVKCDMSYIVEIKPESGQDPITWLLMIVGLITGLALGFGLTYWRNVSTNKTKSDDLSPKNDDSKEKETSTGKMTSDSSPKSKKKVIRKL